MGVGAHDQRPLGNAAMLSALYADVRSILMVVCWHSKGTPPRKSPRNRIAPTKKPSSRRRLRCGSRLILAAPLAAGVSQQKPATAGGNGVQDTQQQRSLAARAREHLTSEKPACRMR